MSSDTFSTANFYLASYLLTVTDADLPEVITGDKGYLTFVFADPDGQVAWAAQAFLMDKTVQRFINSLKRLKNLRKAFERQHDSHGTQLQDQLHKVLSRGH